MDREEDRHPRRDPLERRDRLGEQRPVDERRPVQGDEQVRARLDPGLARPPAGRGSGPRARPACRSSCCRRTGSRSSATPSARRLSSASGECRKSSSERWSATIRLISSGIVRSKLRSPDSTWPTGISEPRRAERRGEGRVDVAGDEHEVGALGAQHRLEPLEHPRRLLAVAAGADAEHVVGLGHAELLEEDLRHRPVVVLAGVDDHRRLGAEALARGRDHRRHLDEVRPRAEDVDDPHRARPDRCRSRKAIWSATARSNGSPT